MLTKFAVFVAGMIMVIITVFVSVPLVMEVYNISLAKKLASIYSCDIMAREKYNIEDVANFIISSDRKFRRRYYVIHYIGGEIITCRIKDGKISIYKDLEEIQGNLEQGD